MPETPPYISFVVASRNDNHGGDMLKRMRIFMRGLVDQCNKHKLHAELIVVEWNPPANGEPLKNEMPEFPNNNYLNVRYIVVPESNHQTLQNADKLPLFQMIAKNVGIRRAKGGFIVCTNIDLLFSDELFQQLALRTLNEGCFYRANRCDVPNTISEEQSTDELLKFCKLNLLNRLGKNSKYYNFKDTSSPIFQYRYAQPIFSLLSFIKSLYANSIKHQFDCLDFDACGDFTLMSKNDWEKIEGYPELEIYSIHIDSMGVIAAAAKNLKQVIFNGEACTYHIRHYGGWEFKAPMDRILFNTRFPMLEWWAVKEAGLELFKTKSTWGINSPQWGLKNHALKEY
jgi:hypothetical protein